VKQEKRAEQRSEPRAATGGTAPERKPADQPKQKP
jgi:hypothetical protein